MKIILLVIISLTSIVFVSAQDPTTAAPESYKLHFENEFMKVLRVTYAPHKKVPLHDHSRFPAAYIYLSDSGPIRFVHADWDDPVLTRPPTKAKSFRLSPTTTAGERHMVENNGDLVSEFLRVEFKTLTQGQDLPHRRVAPREAVPDKNVSYVEFENEKLRVTRMIVSATKLGDIAVGANGPTMVVALTQGRSNKKAGRALEHLPGDVVWMKQGDSLYFAGSASGPFEILLFELLQKKPN
jgi:hypothetical protein